MDKKSPIFIIGCARSGTSILGEFFEQNSTCHYFFEDDIWSSVYHNKAKFFIITFIKQNTFLTNEKIRKVHQKISSCLRKIIHYPNYGHRLKETDVTDTMIDNVNKVRKKVDKRIIIKNPRNSLRIPFIKKLFPDAKFLHIIRDGRDVTCSLKRGMEGNLWSHPKPNNWGKWKNKPYHLKCAWLWNSILEQIHEDVRKIPQDDYLEVKYEELISEPEKIMTNIFNTLNIPFEIHQQNLCKKVKNDLIKGDYHSKYSDKWTVYNHKKRIGRYKENLSTTELTEVNKIIGYTNSKLNYS